MNRPARIVGLVALAVGLIGGWVMWPGVHDGVVFLDDGVYLQEAMQHRHAAVRWAFTTAAPFYYHPLTRLSHALDCRWWGENLAGHHATSIVLHGLNAGLVVWLMWLVARVVPVFSVGERVVLSGAVGLIFAIHPLQVESVVWLAERKNVLCGFFSLACLCSYLGSSRRVGVATTLWFVAALLSKPMAVSLPVVMLALDYFPLRRDVAFGWWRLVKEKAALLGVAAAFCVATVIAQWQVGALTGLGRQGVWQRVVVAVRAVVFYQWKLVWPAWLSPYYPLEGEVTLTEVEFLVPAILVGGAVGVVIWQRKRWPALAAAMVAFGAWLFPTAGLVQSGPQAAADRFMYLAMLPPVAMLAGAAIWAWRKLAVPGRAAVAVIAGFELLFFGFQTRGQIPVWHDDAALWQTVLTYYPNSGFANCEMARALVRRDRYAEAVGFAETATRLTPSFGPAHATLNYIYLQLGRPAVAGAEQPKVPTR